MLQPLIVVARIVAAGAAVFALLGACGRPPTAPSPRDAEALVGAWTGSIGSEAATLEITLIGDIPDGTVTLAGSAYLTERSQQSRLTGRQNVILVFRASSRLLHLVGGVSADGTRFSGTASGLWETNQPFVFTKR
jgi:hypothetical protein